MDSDRNRASARDIPGSAPNFPVAGNAAEVLSRENPGTELLLQVLGVGSHLQSENNRLIGFDPYTFADRRETSCTHKQEVISSRYVDCELAGRIRSCLEAEAT